MTADLHHIVKVLNCIQCKQQLEFCLKWLPYGGDFNGRTLGWIDRNFNVLSFTVEEKGRAVGNKGRTIEDQQCMVLE